MTPTISWMRLLLQDRPAPIEHPETCHFAMPSGTRTLRSQIHPA